ncbi:MAG: DHH family phosphoesterase [Methanotrichaceae archaeon]|nr:DHH family phosphoesterase [Methanotrichaceae archaeon]
MCELIRICSKAAEDIRRQSHVAVASHIDADGLTAAGIICAALDRQGIEHLPLFFKQLDATAIERIADLGEDLVIFTDLGSGMVEEIASLGIPAVIADHHALSQSKAEVLAHINPHLVGADGATDLSGSGTSFLLAREISRANEDLSALAVVGAVGDLQDMAEGRLVGINREILEIGRSVDVLSFGPDLKLFGKQTRPLYKVLEYSSDPYIPGLSGNEEACILFLKEIGIRLGGERWRKWIDLDREERSRTVSALIRRGLRCGLSNHQLSRLVGEVYTLLHETEGCELRDASEYSTLLNATARYGHSAIGLRVCMGDRGKAFDEARVLLSQHRQNLVNGLNLVKMKGITPLGHIQYFDAGGAILDTIVGIVAGMSFQMADRSKPILALALTDDGDMKVSARGTADLVRSGLNLAQALSASAKAVGGRGGGHNVAAGATIPHAACEEFLGLVDRLVGEQISSGRGLLGPQIGGR